MIIREESTIKDTALQVSKKMLAAARTAPKGRGINTMEMCIITDDDLEIIAKKMEDLASEHGQAFFSRDAQNVRNSDALILMGCKIEPLGLAFCGLCGLENCDNKLNHSDVPCAFNTGDLGIAIGSAVSIAADNRVDNRIFYTVGMAARDLKILSPEVKIIYGIGLSIKSKNIFFDRQKR